MNKKFKICLILCLLFSCNYSSPVDSTTYKKWLYTAFFAGLGMNIMSNYIKNFILYYIAPDKIEEPSALKSTKEFSSEVGSGTGTKMLEETVKQSLILLTGLAMPEAAIAVSAAFDAGRSALYLVESGNDIAKEALSNAVKYKYHDLGETFDLVSHGTLAHLQNYSNWSKQKRLPNLVVPSIEKGALVPTFIPFVSQEAKEEFEKQKAEKLSGSLAIFFGVALGITAINVAEFVSPLFIKVPAKEMTFATKILNRGIKEASKRSVLTLGKTITSESIAPSEVKIGGEVYRASQKDIEAVQKFIKNVGK